LAETERGLHGGAPRAVDDDQDAARAPEVRSAGALELVFPAQIPDDEVELATGPPDTPPVDGDPDRGPVCVGEDAPHEPGDEAALPDAGGSHHADLALLHPHGARPLLAAL